MKPVVRGTGLTQTEKTLAKICDKTFLELWSYPNLYIDKKLRGAGDGVELCDNLIVFGNNVIIISDKTIGFDRTIDVSAAWGRWYKRAVEKSANQINGAARWLRDFPERVFLDKECQSRLPIELPSRERMRVFGICVASGCEAAADHFWDEKQTGLAISSMMIGEDHKSLSGATATPFTIGDVNPGRLFIHVFDSHGLDRLFNEFDAAPDLLRYLTHREAAIRRPSVFYCSSEPNLVAHYLFNEEADGQHFIIPSDDRAANIVIAPGMDAALARRPEYKAKRRADRVSYAWDRLISLFAKNLLDGTSVVVAGSESNISTAEPGLRFMAGENRFGRRMLSVALIDALQNIDHAKHHRFARIVKSSSDGQTEVAYVFLIFKYADWMTEHGGYERYREVRAAQLSTYCYKVLIAHPKLEYVVGIAMEPPAEKAKRQGGSEDLVAIGNSDWTQEFRDQIREDCLRFNILNEPERLAYSRLRQQEFPHRPTNHSVTKGSKQKRLFRP